MDWELSHRDSFLQYLPCILMKGFQSAGWDMDSVLQVSPRLEMKIKSYKPHSAEWEAGMLYCASYILEYHEKD